MIGLGADGAHSMMDDNHSLQSLLKKDCEHLFAMKCICHSYASSKLPNETETTVRDVYAYLQSSKR